MPSLTKTIVAATLLVACAPPTDLGGARAPIVDGVRETGEDAVVLVSTFGALSLCTGTLVAPNVVLTAKHCVQPPGADAPYPMTAFTVGIGSAVGATTNYRVRYVETTPGVYNQSETTGLSGEIFGIDVAILILREAVEGVTPIPIRRDRPDDMIGQTFTAIGFGRTPEGGSGVKYKGDGVLEAVTAGVLLTQEVICSGDSGGPMIQEMPLRQVIGVASFGQAGACPSSRDGYNAVFNNLDLIDRGFALAGQCLGGDETCNSLDDDCDGMVDEGCLALGETCAANDECAHAQLPSFLEPLESPIECLDTGSGLTCTRPCDPTRPATSCGTLEVFDEEPAALEGFYCRRSASSCEGFCAPGAPGAGTDGAPCDADAECGSLLCIDPGDGARRCLPPCRAGEGECPVDEICVARATACGACVDASIVIGTRGLGEPCRNDDECSDATGCIDDACSRACDEASPCPEGYRCDASVCLRGTPGATGDPCADGPDCADATFCATQGDRGWCSHLCEIDADCPAEMECTSTPAGSICTPEGALLGESCAEGELCVDGMCEDRTCTRTCGAGEPCPLGFDCRRDANGNARCLARRASGCTASPASGTQAPASALLLLLALFGVRARRRRT